MFQEVFIEVLFCNFVVAWISSQLLRQKEGLFAFILSDHFRKDRDYPLELLFDKLNIWLKLQHHSESFAILFVCCVSNAINCKSSGHSESM